MNFCYILSFCIVIVVAEDNKALFFGRVSLRRELYRLFLQSFDFYLLGFYDLFLNNYGFLN